MEVFLFLFDLCSSGCVHLHIERKNNSTSQSFGGQGDECSLLRRCFNEDACVSVPDAEGYVMVLQPEEPKISLSGIDHFARSAAEFESQEGVTLFPELRIVSTITREVEADTEPEAADGADDDPTGKTGHIKQVQKSFSGSSNKFEPVVHITVHAVLNVATHILVCRLSFHCYLPNY